MSEVHVFLHGNDVATVRIHRNNQVTLRYRDDYLARPDPTPLSLALPLQDKPMDISIWLDGLLPDNYEVRLRWVREHKAASTQPIDILKTKIGLDCAGAVQFCTPENLEHISDRDQGFNPVTEESVSEWLQQLIRDRTLWSRHDSGGAFSLAGAQAKIALHYEDSKWYIPYGGYPTTRIVKPGVAHLRDSDVIEHVCMAAARHIGIPAAETAIMQIGESRALVVKRYDRYQSVLQQWERRHQEDVCQALNIPPYLKYEKDGGPNIKTLARLIKQNTPVWGTDLERFADALLYNWIIAGSDAHSKNYSLILHASEVSLSPLYDVSSYLPYVPQGTEISATTMAMSIGGGRTLAVADQRESWLLAAKDLGIPSSKIVARATELAEGIHSVFVETAQAMPETLQSSPYVESLLKLVAVRAKHCLHVIHSNNPMYLITHPASDYSPDITSVDNLTALTLLR